MNLQVAPGSGGRCGGEYTLNSPPDCQFVDSMFLKLAPENEPEIRNQAAFELARKTQYLSNPRTLRGGVNFAANPEIAKSLLRDVYRWLLDADGELQYQLLKVIANIGDQGFVLVADHITNRGVDDETYSAVVTAATQIAGPDAIGWLRSQKGKVSHLRKSWVESAIQMINLGGFADYAEGLDETQAFQFPAIRPAQDSVGENSENDPLTSMTVWKEARFGGAVDKFDTTEYRNQIQRLAQLKTACADV